jgi:hypothetical protein
MVGSTSGAGAVDPWTEVDKNKRIAQSYLNEMQHGASEPTQIEAIEDWEPQGLPVAVWTKNWYAQLFWQLLYLGVAVLFMVSAINGLSNRQVPIGVGVLFLAVGLLGACIGVGSMLLPRRRAERFDDGTFAFSRGSKRLVVRPGELDALGYIYGGRILGRPYPLSIASRRGNCTLAVLSNMRGLVNELHQENPKATLIDPFDWDT